MRVTQNSSANNAIYNIQQQRSRMDSLQESISTGRKVNRPSDDPLSSAVLLDANAKLNALSQYSTNISKADTWVKFTDTALNGITDIMTQAKKVISTINSGSSDPSLRQSAHDQLVELKKQVVDMGNIKMGDQYIFGGTNNSTPPFSNSSSIFAGNSTPLTIEIAQDTTQAVSITGDRLLKGTSTPSAPPNYGTTDIMQTFDNLITAVGDLTTASDTAAIVQGATDLQAGFVQVTSAIGDNIARMTRLDSMAKLTENNKNILLQIVDNLQTVDYAKLGIELNNQKTAFEASLSTSVRISQLSLLNYY